MPKWIDKFGRNPDIDSIGTPEDIWDGGSTYVFVAAAGATTIISDSTQDDAGSTAFTGAKTVTIEGLSSTFGRLTETITLGGTSAQSFTNQFYRVHRAYVETAGAAGSNVGNLQVSISTQVVAQVTASLGQTLMAIYTTPVDWDTCKLIGWRVSLARLASGSAEVALQTRANGGAWRTRDYVGVGVGTPYFNRYHENVMALAPGTDIRLRCYDVSQNDSVVSGGFEMYWPKDVT